MHHFVYKSINILTGEYYVGVHSSKNLDSDEYFGSGIKIKYQVQKYGKHCFVREILVECDTRNEAFDREKSIVNEDLLKDPLCLNLTKGGKGMAEDHTLSAREKIGKAASSRNKGKRYDINSERKPGVAKGTLSPLKGRKNPHSALHKKNLCKNVFLTKEEKLQKRRANYKSVAKYSIEERKQKRREAKLGTSQSDVSRQKISETMKMVHAKRKLLKSIGDFNSPTFNNQDRYVGDQEGKNDV